MNAGFSNLITIKKNLLAPALVAASDFDERITALGLGVAGAMGKYCARKFARVVNDTEIIGADRVEFLLSRFPIESVSKIELKLTEAQGWQELVINDVLNTIDLDTGIVHFAGNRDVGPHYAQVRFTYTGGFWWDITEDNTGVLPAGATKLPDDLLLALIEQCKTEWETFDKIGDKISEVGSGSQSASGTLPDLKLTEIVKQRIDRFVRYNLV